MNKYKKLAIAAVSMVMAGTMVFSLAACGNGGNDGPNVKPTDKPDEYGVLNDDGSLNYDAYKRDSEVTLNLGIGHNNDKTSTSYKALKAQITMPDGVNYNDGDMKPAWKAMGKDLNITWKDVYQNVDTGSNIETMTTKSDEDGVKWYEKTDMFTTDLSKAVSYAAAGTDILNLADYLNYMPNFAAFLENNPIVYLSLLQNGMSTKDGSGKVLYVAPYFDGNDDIERYCIIRHDWAKTILNGTTTLEGSAAWGKATSVAPYFEKGYEIESLTSDGKSKQTIKKDFDAALKAAKDTSTALGSAYNAIAGAAYAGTSGNIVAIMNAAIAANQNVTGAQLTNLYRAYIDVAYKVGSKAAYTAETRANLFIGYDAAWDADDLVAILRCVTTNASALGASAVGGIAPRSGDMDRTPDIVSLAGQLFGARGATSRNEYTYIDANGTLQDARNDQHFYDALLKMNKMKEEGLVVDYSNTSYNGTGGFNGDTPNFMLYDYSQTQTLNGFYVEDDKIPDPKTIPDEYYLAPILTPVAQWDVNGNGKYGENKNEIIRFTESWRSTKTGGLCLNGSLAKAGNEAKLKAALNFVDYLFHLDGQIVSTYGPMADNANGDNGFWYNTEATAAQKDAGEYFMFKGKAYAGSEYKGRYTPTITNAVYDSFKGKTVNGWKVGDNSAVSGAKLSFTNYARMLIGSTLPIGNKDQSFENQLTSLMGQDGAGKVGTALAADVVKGMSLNVKKDNYWFTVVPSGLPQSGAEQTQLDADGQLRFRCLSGERFNGQDKKMYSIFSWLILNGENSGKEYNYQSQTYTITTAQALCEDMAGALGGQTRETTKAAGWTRAKSYWEYLDPTK